MWDRLSNPLVMVTLQFQDGARLTWKLTKPVKQFDVFAEIGMLAGKYDLGIDFDIPAPTVETPDAAGGGTNDTILDGVDHGPDLSPGNSPGNSAVYRRLQWKLTG